MMERRTSTFAYPVSRFYHLSALLGIGLLLVWGFPGASVQAQFQRDPTPNDTLNSPVILADHHLRFSIYAPQADDVRLGGTDIPNLAEAGSMAKAANGVWNVVVGPLEPGSYRYLFQVDGIQVLDPRNPVTSESNANAWSLVHLPGNEYMDMRNVPHGAVSEVTYFSTSLNRTRRMHVYTPPGYERGKGSYPTFYLLHGAFDCDDAWTTVGRAAVILDNLIAQNQARPMIVVMPAGHTGPFRFGQPPENPANPWQDAFVEDFQTDIRPFVEKHYRVKTKRKDRAIAGLSMGGAHTLNIAMSKLEDFAYIGVFSSGIFSLSGQSGDMNGGQAPSWTSLHQETLTNSRLKEDLALVWFATGEDDFLLNTTHETVALLKEYGFDVVYHETAGGHTWVNWRDYLHQFLPLLF